VTPKETGTVDCLRSVDEGVLRSIWYAHVIAERGERWPAKMAYPATKLAVELVER
jgi:hypothetical protein